MFPKKEKKGYLKPKYLLWESNFPVIRVKKKNKKQKTSFLLNLSSPSVYKLLWSQATFLPMNPLCWLLFSEQLANEYYPVMIQNQNLNLLNSLFINMHSSPLFWRWMAIIIETSIMNIKAEISVFRYHVSYILAYPLSLSSKENFCMNAAIRWAIKGLIRVHGGVIFWVDATKGKMLYGSKSSTSLSLLF